MLLRLGLWGGAATVTLGLPSFRGRRVRIWNWRSSGSLLMAPLDNSSFKTPCIMVSNLLSTLPDRREHIHSRFPISQVHVEKTSGEALPAVG